MCLRILGFVFLVVFPGALHAQETTPNCLTFHLTGGFFIPNQPFYDNGSTLTYSCDPGLKPAVEGWWATSTCQNGEWSDQPECIDVNACLPPTILNAKYTQSTDGWYENGSTITVTCEEGYEHKNKENSITCVNGAWSSLPICQKSLNGCNTPLRLANAVVINEYQEFFAANSKLRYECEDGYTTEGSNAEKYITCEAGNWIEGLKCTRNTRQDTGHSTSGNTGSSGTDMNDRGTGPRPIRIDHCGVFPVVLDGVVVETKEFSIKYQCASFYQIVGPERVTCLENRSWSEVPSCKATFCTVNTALVSKYKNIGVVYIKNGETRRLECTHQKKWWFTNHSDVKCMNGVLESTNCCTKVQLDIRGNC